MTVRLRLRGAKEVKAKLREVARRTAREAEKRVEVGWFEDSGKYPGDSRPPAQVALVNEFGSRDQPPRPFFRSALPKAAPEVLRELARAVDPEGGIDNARLLRAGKVVRDHVRASMLRYRVRDSGHLHRSIEVKRKGTGE